MGIIAASVLFKLFINARDGCKNALPGILSSGGKQSTEQPQF